MNAATSPSERAQQVAARQLRVQGYRRRGEQHQQSRARQQQALAELEGEVATADELRQAWLSRPRRRADCARVPRPCPYVSCRYNLFLDVLRDGTLRLTSPERRPGEVPLEESCALDVVERHPDGLRLEQVGQRMHLTRERIRQIQDQALSRLNLRHPRLFQELMVWLEDER